MTQLTGAYTFVVLVQLEIDYRLKIAGAKMAFTGRPPLSRLRRRFAPLRGALRRCAALRAAVSTALRAGALRAQLL